MSNCPAPECVDPGCTGQYEHWPAAPRGECDGPSGALELYLRIKDFCRDSVANGDMTLSAERTLLKILTDWGSPESDWEAARKLARSLQPAPPPTDPGAGWDDLAPPMAEVPREANHERET